MRVITGGFLAFVSMFATCVSGRESDCSIEKAEASIQRMERLEQKPLSSAAIGNLKKVLDCSSILDAPKLAPATIEALGDLLFWAVADAEFQETTVEDRIADRIGIDVDARGFANLVDRIDLRNGKAPRYGSIADTDGQSRSSEEVRSVQRLRRWIGLDKEAERWSVPVSTPAAVIPLAMARAQYPAMPKLRTRLMNLLKADQEVRNLDASASDEKSVAEKMDRVDARNLIELRAIFRSTGFPTNAQVGRAGTMAAWALVQHAVSDPDLMRRAVAQAEGLHNSGDLPDGPYALLVDRVACVVEHKPQVYGTFGNHRDPKHPLYCAIGDPGRVNERRATVFLSPLSESRPAAAGGSQETSRIGK